MQENGLSGRSASDEGLVERIKRGDLEAFEELVNKYKKEAFYLAYSLTSNKEVAEDLSQEAFIKVFKKIGDFREESSFHTWFSKIIVNLCRSHMRHQYLVRRFSVLFRKAEEDEPEKSIETSVADRSATGDPLRLTENRQLRESIDAAVNDLPGLQREVFILKHVRDMKIKDIAQIMGMKEGTVKTHLFRAVNKLQRVLEAYKEG